MLSPIECAKIGLLYFFNRYKTFYLVQLSVLVALWHLEKKSQKKVGYKPDVSDIG
jgi:hypothetical protein